mmetsp:Transcript_20547/g.38219  ORF Transcript_20547/g.38219 Transcript_20547/m.38219 type:complete len:166 (+) Transcript_20547:3015-3512(+)
MSQSRFGVFSARWPWAPLRGPGCAGGARPALGDKAPKARPWTWHGRVCVCICVSVVGNLCSPSPLDLVSPTSVLDEILLAYAVLSAQRRQKRQRRQLNHYQLPSLPSLSISLSLPLVLAAFVVAVPVLCRKCRASNWTEREFALPTSRARRSLRSSCVLRKGPSG